MGQEPAKPCPQCTKCANCHVNDTTVGVGQKEKETTKKEETSEAKEVTISTCETEKENTKSQQQILRPETATE